MGEGPTAHIIKSAEESRYGIQDLAITPQGAVIVSGDVRISDPIVIGTINVSVDVSGDVTTVPKAGEIWPVRQTGGWSTAVSGDVTLGAGTSNIGDVDIVSSVPLTIGAITAPIGISGDVNVTVTIADILTIGAVTAPLGVSGDVMTVPKAGQTWQTREQGVVGVQIVGGAVGGRFNVSGDINVLEQGKIGVHVASGLVGISGDITATNFDIRDLNPGQDSVRIHGGIIGVSGDVSTTPKAGQTWPVSIATTVNVAEQSKIGVHVSSGQIGISGDVSATNFDIRNLNPSQDSVRIHGGIIGVSGDVSTTPKSGETWPVTQSGSWSIASSGDVALVDGSNRGTKATVYTSGAIRVSGDVQVINPIVIGTVNVSVDISGDVTTVPKQGEVWTVAHQGAIGAQLVGGSIGGTVGVSGDINVREQQKIGVHVSSGQIGISGDVNVTATNLDIRDLNISQDSVRIGGGITGISGDVSTTPKAGEVWPVRQATTWSTAVSGDVSTFPRAGDVWNIREQGTVGVQIVGGSVGSRISASGDLSVTVQNKVGTHVASGLIGISGDITATNLDIRDLNIGQDSVRIGGGTIGVSGDVLLRSPLPALASGDAIVGRIRLVDAQDSSLSVRVYDTRALRISGDVRSADYTNSFAYGNVNITTTATLIRAVNTRRIFINIQNVENRMAYIGFDSSVTVGNGTILDKTVNSSGDGGFWGTGIYRGDVYGIVASGDGDVRYQELIG